MFRSITLFGIEVPFQQCKLTFRVDVAEFETTKGTDQRKVMIGRAMYHRTEFSDIFTGHRKVTESSARSVGQDQYNTYRLDKPRLVEEKL